MIKYEEVEICKLCEGHGKKILKIIKRFDTGQDVKKFVEDCKDCYGHGHTNKIIGTIE